jgi:ribonuclease P protein component
MCHEADLSAEQPGACAPARLPLADGDPGWPQGDPCASRSRSRQAVGVVALGLTGLKQRKDYLAANAGRRAPMPGFVLLVRDRADESADMRIGITVSKKVGNAVIRNRMKRRFRALAREILPESGVPGADHVLIGRNGGIERDHAALKAELVKALAKVQRA